MAGDYLTPGSCEVNTGDLSKVLRHNRFLLDSLAFLDSTYIADGVLVIVLRVLLSLLYVDFKLE